MNSTRSMSEEELSAGRPAVGPLEAARPVIRDDRGHLPLAIKVGFTAFMAVLVPVYWFRYGVTNFLYFCDVALFLTLVGMWWEKRLLVSMAAVGILIPQALWVVDFAGNLGGVQLTGMTNYMFDPDRSLFLRGLSLFHGWLPFLLLFLVWWWGYDRRALVAWTVLAWGLVLICYLYLPAPGAELSNPQAPTNINYVHGMSETSAQTWMPPNLYVLTLMVGLLVLVYLPTHFALDRLFGRPQQRRVGRR